MKSAMTERKREKWKYGEGEEIVQFERASL
jgi:hypothetical protein